MEEQFRMLYVTVYSKNMGLGESVGTENQGNKESFCPMMRTHYARDKAN
jgi:hypothetical protein